MNTLKTLCLAILLGMIGCQSFSTKFEYEKSYLKGLELSERLNKPIFVHFTGLGCISGRMDLTKAVQKELNREFVTVLLYVDDRTKIEESDTLGLYKIGFTKTYSIKLKRAKTIGNIHATIQAEKFNSNIQPLSVIIDKNQTILVEPFGYTKDEDLFLEKLEDGLNKFKAME